MPLYVCSAVRQHIPANYTFNVNYLAAATSSDAALPLADNDRLGCSAAGACLRCVVNGRATLVDHVLHCNCQCSNAIMLLLLLLLLPLLLSLRT
jgi:hypothetical protein